VVFFIRLCRIEWWKYFFPLADPSRSTALTYSQNHDFEDFLLSKCVSIETIKKYDMVFDYARSNSENVFSSHPPLSLYHLHIHTKSRFGGFAPQKMRFKRNNKKYDMIFNHSGSNSENIFSTHAPLSHYRIHIHTYFIK